MGLFGRSLPVKHTLGDRNDVRMYAYMHRPLAETIVLLLSTAYASGARALRPTGAGGWR